MKKVFGGGDQIQGSQRDDQEAEPREPAAGAFQVWTVSTKTSSALLCVQPAGRKSDVRGGRGRGKKRKKENGDAVMKEEKDQVWIKEISLSV